MSTYKITGGKELCGEITPVPNKNSILKIIPAALLTNEPVTLHNVPKSSDVGIMFKMIESLGGTVEFLNDQQSSVVINASNLQSSELDPELSSKIKAGAMFMAPLIKRFGKAFLPIPGGCKLGTRPMDAFISNMEQLGVAYEPTKAGFFLRAQNLKATKIWSWFPSVTGTENLIILAVMTPGTTEIYNAACEPHTQDLCNFLVSMGAKIRGIGSNKLIIEGVEELHGTEWSIIGEHLDVGAYIAAALLTNSEITIKDAVTEHMGMIVQVFEKLNAKVEVDFEKDTITIPKNQELICEKTVNGHVYDVKSFAWPLMPPDFVHIPIAVALKAQGSIIFHNTFYEFGYFYIEQFLNYGANVVMGDPHRVVTFGPNKLKAAKINAPYIIQATVALFLVGLAAHGETTLHDPYDSLIRRYPDLVEKYRSLGAEVRKVS